MVAEVAAVRIYALCVDQEKGKYRAFDPARPKETMTIGYDKPSVVLAVLEKGLEIERQAEQKRKEDVAATGNTYYERTVGVEFTGVLWLDEVPA
jgi:hypothetical protein